MASIWKKIGLRPLCRVLKPAKCCVCPGPRNCLLPRVVDVSGFISSQRLSGPFLKKKLVNIYFEENAEKIMDSRYSLVSFQTFLYLTAFLEYSCGIQFSFGLPKSSVLRIDGGKLYGGMKCPQLAKASNQDSFDYSEFLANLPLGVASWKTPAQKYVLQQRNWSYVDCEQRCKFAKLNVKVIVSLTAQFSNGECEYLTRFSVCSYYKSKPQHYVVSQFGEISHLRNPKMWALNVVPWTQLFLV